MPYKKGIPYVDFIDRPNAALKLVVIKSASISEYVSSDIVTYFEYTRAGVCLILAILHLALFWFNPSQKANLYFFAYALLLCIAYMVVNLSYRQVHYTATRMYIYILTYVALSISSLFFVLAIYRTFQLRLRWVFWLVAIMLFGGWTITATSYSDNPVLNILTYLLSLLPQLEAIRVTVLALRKGQRGAKIVIGGCIAFTLFWVLAYLFALGYITPGRFWVYGNFAFNLAFISIPVAISIYLALESSFASRTLQEKLLEVQELSQTTRQQEFEKQQLLASEKERLEQQVAERTSELKHSLQELKATQAQLIQSEKMASLGELTAGIAHEIQNPLNFVNNFSESNIELLRELKQENGNGNKAEVDVIAHDAIQNQQKILHHGKRAEDIVKSMLEHSRTSKGEKQQTDLNTLVDEYLRLAYHGFRAKDKSFNAGIHTHFDDSIGIINIVPQDIGRVLLNIISNAFYAVAEKAKNAEPSYEPSVAVGTRKANNSIEISVQDNGMGISKSIKDKVFQPFFTTKPTGEGTGLRLSLSHDIVKAHGGELKVESTEGEGSEFTIALPV